MITEDGKLKYKHSGILFDTKEGPPDAKWIFVLSVSKILYAGMKRKGNFQHSSFLAGGATLSAGRIVVDDGVLKVKNKRIFLVLFLVDSYAKEEKVYFAKTLCIKFELFG